MVTWSPHGGGCCGIIHLWDFGVSPEALLKTAGTNPRLPYKDEAIEHWLVRVIKQALESAFGDDYEEGWNALVEVVLTTFQRDTKLWGDVLKRVGFKEVTSFLNDNSGNTCHVFHLQTKEL